MSPSCPERPITVPVNIVSSIHDGLNTYEYQTSVVVNTRIVDSILMLFLQHLFSSHACFETDFDPQYNL